LSEFVAEIRNDVAENKLARDGRPCTPVAEVSRPVIFWKKKQKVCIPFSNETTLQEAILQILESISTAKFKDLFTLIPPCEKRYAPDEMIPEIKIMEDDAEARGYSNGEDDIFHAYTETITGSNIDNYKSLLATMIWRETCWLQARRLLLILADEGFIDTVGIESPYDVESSKLCGFGENHYQKIAKSPLVRLWQTPPKGCLGGHWEVPMWWIANVLGEASSVAVYSARNVVDTILADIVTS
jgi:hypothetical protein